MWILAGCTVISLAVCLPLFLHYKPIRLPLAVSFKALGTLCALVPALIAALRLDTIYWFFAAAIFIHTIADVLLEYWFEAGLGAFLLGHILYLSAFLKLFPLSAAHLILLVCFLAGLGYVFFRHRSLLGKHLVPFSVYALALCLMASCGIAGGTTVFSRKGLMIAFGSALFLFSDCMILRRLLWPSRGKADFLILLTYYLSQLLLGGSCLF